MGWFRYSNSETVIVFLHGLFSNSEKCWTEESGTYWPELISEDVRFDNISLYVAEYYTDVDSRDYGIQECVKEVRALISRIDEQGREPPINKRNIIFLCHSAGGVVARYLLESHSDDYLCKKVGLCLFASPSFGSKIASIAGGISIFFGNQLAKELGWGSYILSDLDGRFKTLLDSKKIDIYGMEAVEHKPPFSAPYLGKLVNHQSAARYFGRNKTIPNADHSSIVKPINIQSASHQILVDFCADFCPKRSAKKKIVISTPSLFDRYDSDHEIFYIERDNDKVIQHLIVNYGLWICGPSGIGKTAAITRALINANLSIKYYSLGGYIGENAEQLFRSFCSELVNSNLSTDLSINECINDVAIFLFKNQDSLPSVFFIEEIPISNESMFIDFSQYIYALLIRIPGSKILKLALSSIYFPNTSITPEFEKISERIRILHWTEWSDGDIARLVNIISKDLAIPEYERPDHLQFKGNPRAVKSLLRDRISRV